MAGYIYLSNSSKPSASAQNTPKAVHLTNMSLPYLRAAHDLGYSLNLGINSNATESDADLPISFFKSFVYRNPLNFKDNLKAYKAVCKAISENDVEAIHCNTPVGGMVGRLAAKKCKVKKVIYQAHGFHFYKGAPKKNWLIFYPIEKLLARFTDAIITINLEDFEAAKKFRLKKGGKVYYVHGVGITTDMFSQVEDNARADMRKELGIQEDDMLLISVGELNKNKNNAVIIRAIAALNNPKIKYILCGVGPEKEALESLAKELCVSEQIMFLGFRRDVPKLYKASDVFVMPSFREGLSRSIMEAMSAGLPCIVSDIRGNCDLIENGENGYLCTASDYGAFAKAIENLAENKALREKMSSQNLEKVKSFDIGVVEKEIKDIYSEVLGK